MGAARYEDSLERMKLLHDAYKAALTMRTPTLEVVRAAYVGGVLDYEDLERLTEAALCERPIQIPEPMLRRFFAS